MASYYNVTVESGEWKKLAFCGPDLDDAIDVAESIPAQNGIVHVIWVNNDIPSGYVTEDGVTINLYGGNPEPYRASAVS